jgi:hypothetical protein
MSSLVLITYDRPSRVFKVFFLLPWSQGFSEKGVSSFYENEQIKTRVDSEYLNEMNNQKLKKKYFICVSLIKKKTTKKTLID